MLWLCVTPACFCGHSDRCACLARLRQAVPNTRFPLPHSDPHPEPETSPRERERHAPGRTTRQGFPPGGWCLLAMGWGNEGDRGDAGQEPAAKAGVCPGLLTGEDWVLRTQVTGARTQLWQFTARGTLKPPKPPLLLGEVGMMYPGHRPVVKGK